MLRTDCLALAALDTLIGAVSSMVFYQPVFLMQGQALIFVQSQVVHGREGSGDSDVLGTDFRAVITSGTGEQRNFRQLFRSEAVAT